MPRFVAALMLCAAASAQIPYEHLIYVHRATSLTVPAIGIVDPDFGTPSPLLPQAGGSLLAHGSRSVAIDPQAPDVLYSITALSTSIAVQVPVLTLFGSRFTRTNLPVSLGVAGTPFKLRWAPGFGLLLMGRGGQVNRIFLRDMTTGQVTAQRTQGILPDFASDLAFFNGKAFATSEGDGVTVTTGTIVEWDLVTNTDRVVGNTYPPLTALHVFGGQLIVGDSNGDLHLVDPVTGSIALFLTLGLGAIRSIAVDSQNRVFVVAENAGISAIYNAFNPTTALFVTANTVADLEIGPAPVPTMLTYGDGCTGSNSVAPQLGFTAPPALGATYGITLASALANTGAFLVIGSSRVSGQSGALPRGLGPLGLPGCVQYTDVLASLFALTGNAGSAQLSFTLPNNPAFAGVRIPVQWLCLDSPANAFGATTSNGGEVYAY